MRMEWMRWECEEREEDDDEDSNFNWWSLYVFI